MRYIGYLVLFALLTLSCMGKQRTLGESTPKVAEADSLSELPLPELPPELTTPEARAAYFAMHFWDAMDFTNHALSLDSAFMEQNFANFLLVLPAVGTRSKAAEAVTALFEQSTKDSTATVFLLDVMERYLHDPNSPMRNEEIFIIFAEQAMMAKGVAQWSKDRMDWMLKDARKNRPGTRAADFAYVDRQGNDHTLYATTTAPLTLLIFFDPECEHCGEITAALSANSMLKSMVDAGKLTVMAVDIESDATTWQRTKNKLPQWWTVGHDEAKAITRQAIYPLPATPVLYLLDRNKKVILKDAMPEEILRMIALSNQYGDQ